MRGCGALEIASSGTVFTGGLTVGETASVVVHAGCKPGNGAVTLNDTATLEVAQSGTVTLGGALTTA